MKGTETIAATAARTPSARPTITIDHQTLEDDMVTIRDRDTMAQERVPISELHRIVSEKVDLRKLLKQL